MRLIDADKLIEEIVRIDDLRRLSTATIGKALSNCPTVDVVRCKDCEYNKYHICTRNQCPVCGHPLYVKDADFCSYGKRRGD